MSLDRPRFRRDLLAEAVVADGQRYVDVHDPATGTSFRLYDFEYHVALAFDGLTFDKIIPWLKLACAIEVSAEQLRGFAARLQELGFLEREPGEVDTGEASPAVVPETAAVAAEPVAEPVAETIVGDLGEAAPGGTVESGAPAPSDAVADEAAPAGAGDADWAPTEAATVAEKRTALPPAAAEPPAAREVGEAAPALSPEIGGGPAPAVGDEPAPTVAQVVETAAPPPVTEAVSQAVTVPYLVPDSAEAKPAAPAPEARIGAPVFVVVPEAAAPPMVTWPAPYVPATEVVVSPAQTVADLVLATLTSGTANEAAADAPATATEAATAEPPPNLSPSAPEAASATVVPAGDQARAAAADAFDDAPTPPTVDQAAAAVADPFDDAPTPPTADHAAAAVADAFDDAPTPPTADWASAAAASAFDEAPTPPVADEAAPTAATDEAAAPAVAEAAPAEAPPEPADDAQVQAAAPAAADAEVGTRPVDSTAFPVLPTPPPQAVESPRPVPVVVMPLVVTPSARQSSGSARFLTPPPYVTPAPSTLGPVPVAVRRRQRRSLLLFGSLGVLAAAAVLAILLPFFFPPRGPASTDVRTVAATPGTVLRYFSGTGTVSPLPGPVFKFPAGGTVIRIVKPGTAVAAGDVLAAVEAAKPLLNQLTHQRERLAFYQQMAEGMRQVGNATEEERQVRKVDERKAKLAKTLAALGGVAVVANAAGEVDEVFTKEGESVEAGSLALRLVSSGHRATFDLPGAQAAEARRLGFCQVGVDGYLFDCVHTQDRSEDSRVTVELPTLPRTLVGRPARLARARFEDAVTLPASAILAAGRAHQVYVVAPSGRVEARPVTLAEQSGGEAIVVQGLDSGDSVVVEPPAELRPGAPVSPRL